jgi:microcystin-dependent protein
MGSYYRDFYAPKATQQPTIGDTKFSVVRQDHMGWMNCDGRLLSTADYELLFRVIGYSFGGSGGQFALPDMRSRVPGAIKQGAGLTNRALGDAVGEETHTLTIAEMPSHNHGTDASDNVVGNNLTGAAGGHTHGITDPSHAHAITDPGHTHSYVNQPNDHQVAVSLTTTDTADNVNVGQTTGSSTTGITVNSNTTGITVNPVANHQHSIATQGGDDPHNNMQPTLFIGNMFMYSGKIHGATSKWRYEIDTNIL